MVVHIRERVGRVGESLATRFLQDRGYRIVDRNFRCSEGEIDIVAEQGGCLVFVEVRTRRSTGYGYPEESISYRKKRRLQAAAIRYLQSAGRTYKMYRFDVVSIVWENDRPVHLIHYENAF